MAETTINLPRDTTLEAIGGALSKIDETLKQGFQGIAAEGKTVEYPQTWAGFKALCQTGSVDRYFAVGDQLKCQYNGKDLVWDIVHIGDKEDGSKYVILQTHYLIDEQMRFDPQEAIFKASAELPPGTYHFSMNVDGCDTRWTNPTLSGWSKNWQFTTTKTIPSGGIIKLPKVYQAVFAPQDVDLAADGVVSCSSPSDTTTLEALALTEGKGGTDLATLGKINHAQRILFGYNRWRDSDMRQWLNSDAGAGNWWSQRNDFDAITSDGYFKTLAGFKNGLDSDFLAVVTKSAITTAVNKTCDSGGTDTTYDYFFIPTDENVNATKNTNYDAEDDTVWEYYIKFRQDGKTGKSRSSDTNRAKCFANGNYYIWAIRSVYSNAYLIDYVNISRSGIGSLENSARAIEMLGIAPACRIN